MIAATPLLVAMLSIGAPVVGSSDPLHTRSHRSVLGACRVTALATWRDSPGGPGSVGGVRVPGNAFLIQRGRSSVLIAPVSMNAADRASMLSGRAAPQAIVLTSLDALQSAALMDDGVPAFPGATIFIDRALLDDPGEMSDAQIGARAVLAGYRRIGRLRVIDIYADPIPGVRIMISPYRPRSESRVRVDCRLATLMVLPAREVAFGSIAGGADRRDDRLPALLASDDYVLALTDGAFPGIGRIYSGHDGYHWGTIAAQGFGGAARRRGQVFVEADDAEERSSIRPATPQTIVTLKP